MSHQMTMRVILGGTFLLIEIILCPCLHLLTTAHTADGKGDVEMERIIHHPGNGLFNRLDPCCFQGDDSGHQALARTIRPGQGISSTPEELNKGLVESQEEWESTELDSRHGWSNRPTGENLTEKDRIRDRKVAKVDNEDGLTLNLTLASFMRAYPVDKWKTLGFFEEKYLREINVFWLQFKPASTYSHYILGSIYIVMMTVGCMGNLLVIILFFRFQNLRSPANYLIVNLAISDFLMLAKTPVFIINSFYEGPALGSIGCQIYGFVGGLTGTTSIMSLAAIAVDRYAVIAHPMCPYLRTTSRRALLMIVGAWIYSFIFSSLPLLGLNAYVSEGYLTSCSFDYLRPDLQSRIFIFVFFLAAWLVPLCLIAFSYLAIFREVMKAETMSIFQGGPSRESFRSIIQNKIRADVKIARLTTFIVLIWVLAWTPYAIVALLGIFGQEHLITPFVSTLPALFCKISSCINPFIYALNHPRFRKELREDFHRLGAFASIAVIPKCSNTTSHELEMAMSEENIPYEERKVPERTKPVNYTCFSTIVETHMFADEPDLPNEISAIEEELESSQTPEPEQYCGVEQNPISSRSRSESNLVPEDVFIFNRLGKDQMTCSKSLDAKGSTSLTF